MLSNGTTIEEKFNESLNRTLSNSHMRGGGFDLSRNTIFPYDESEFGKSVVVLRFPSNKHHPSFGCTFNAISKSWPSFQCRTYSIEFDL